MEMGVESDDVANVQKMCILLVIDEASLGGGQMHVLLLAKYLHKANFEVEIATEASGWLVDEARKLDLRVHQIAISNQATWQSFLQIHQLLKQKQFDVLHTHGGTAGFWIRVVAAMLKKRPVIVHTYHGLHYLNILEKAGQAIQQKVKRAIFKLIDRLLLSYTDRTICVCRSDYDKAIAAGVATIDQTSIVYNGIELAKFSIPLDQLIARKLFNLDPTEFVFGNVGRLHEQKGHKFLLQAMAKMNNQSRLIIVGDGRLRENLMILAADLKISDRVLFLGARADINEFLSAINVFILPSLWEGQPIALLEALAIGKPCIASSVDGIPEIITDGINGYLVNPKDVETLASVMDLAIEQPELLREFSRCSPKAISQKFLAQNMAMEIANIYTTEQNSRV
jgi:glycosyltransferase involved in cell wall biosynthesis